MAEFDVKQGRERRDPRKSRAKGSRSWSHNRMGGGGIAAACGAGRARSHDEIETRSKREIQNWTDAGWKTRRSPRKSHRLMSEAGGHGKDPRGVRVKTLFALPEKVTANVCDVRTGARPFMDSGIGEVERGVFKKGVAEASLRKDLPLRAGPPSCESLSKRRRIKRRSARSAERRVAETEAPFEGNEMSTRYMLDVGHLAMIARSRAAHT